MNGMNGKLASILTVSLLYSLPRLILDRLSRASIASRLMDADQKNRERVKGQTGS